MMHSMTKMSTTLTRLRFAFSSHKKGQVHPGFVAEVPGFRREILYYSGTLSCPQKVDNQIDLSTS